MRGLFGKALVVLCFGAVELYLLLIAFLRSGSNYGLRLFSLLIRIPVYALGVLCWKWSS